MNTIIIKDGSGNSKYYDVIGTGTALDPYSSVKVPYEISHALLSVYNDYGHTISVRDKRKSLIKFGRNPSISTNITETVQETGGMETYQTGNTINTLVSSSPSDTQQVVIEGHTLSGSNFTFVTQTLTLNGVTEVPLTTPLARVTRLYNNGSTNFAGNVTVKISGGETFITVGTTNQSEKCSTTLSSVDYWIITSMNIGVNRSQTAVVDFELQIRDYGKVFRTVYIATQANGGRQIDFTTPILVRPNSDIRVVATANANNVSVTASIAGYLAIIQ